MKRRVRLTESDLNRIVMDSVQEILREGQGWDTFKHYMKHGGMPGDYRQGFDPEEWIKTGKEDDSDTEEHDTSWTGRLGRRAAWGGLTTLGKLGFNRGYRRGYQLQMR